MLKFAETSLLSPHPPRGRCAIEKLETVILDLLRVINNSDMVQVSCLIILS